MTDGGFLLGKPENLQCEVKAPFSCRGRASYIYGPECEAQTGKLMYLCDQHAAQIRDWKAAHGADPVECPTHGRIGRVKDYLILKELTT